MALPEGVMLDIAHWELCVECFLHAPVASLLNRACVCARGVFLASMRQCVLSSQLAMT